MSRRRSRPGGPGGAGSAAAAGTAAAPAPGAAAGSRTGSAAGAVVGRLGALRARLGRPTLRGTCCAAAGLALLVIGVAVSQADLVRLGALLLLLVVAAVVLVSALPPRVEVHRTLAPSRTTPGTPSRVRVRVRARGALLPRHLEAEDHRDPALGGPVRFVVERAGADRWTTVTYQLRPQRRGRHRVGPLTISPVDPLGLVRSPATPAGHRDEGHLLVLPRVEALGDAAGRTRQEGDAERARETSSATGEHSSEARDYRTGEVVRRVHWRATARAGRLMLRQDEQPHRQHAVVLLDTRAAAHPGRGGAASFEWAVSAAASVVALHGSGGAPVQLVTGPTAVVGGVEDLLDALAVVDLDPGDAVPDPRALSDLGRAGGRASVVAVLGEVGAELLPLLVAVPSRGVRATALLVDAAGWTEPVGPVASTAPTAGSTAGSAAGSTAGSVPGAAAGTGAATAAALRAAGWQVCEARRGDAVAAAWERATGAPSSATGPDAGPPAGPGAAGTASTRAPRSPAPAAAPAGATAAPVGGTTRGDAASPDATRRGRRALR